MTLKTRTTPTLIEAARLWGESLAQGFRDALGITPAPATTDRAISLNAIISKVCHVLYENYPVAYVLDVFQDGPATYAIVNRDGKLYRYNVLINTDTGDVTIGEAMEVVMDFVPVNRTTTSIIRQADGRVRWFEVSCTAVLNRVGEIDSTELFDNFEKHAQESGNFGFRDFFHLGESYRVGTVDYLKRDGAVLITSGLYDENNELAQAEITAREADPDKWGASIQYSALSDPDMVEIAQGIKIPVYRDGVFVSVTTLPETMAAAWGTAGAQLQGVMRMKTELSDPIFASLVEMFGGDEAKAREFAEAHPNARNREIVETGKVVRAKREGATETAVPASTPAAANTDTAPAALTNVVPAVIALPEDEEDDDEAPALELDEAAMRELARSILESPAFETFINTTQGLLARLDTLEKSITANNNRTSAVAQKVDGLITRVAEVEKDDEAKLQETIQDLPRNRQTRAVTYRPREAGEAGQVQSSAEIAANTMAKIKAREAMKPGG